MRPTRLVIPVPGRVGLLLFKPTKAADASTGPSSFLADALRAPVLRWKAALHGVKAQWTSGAASVVALYMGAVINVVQHCLSIRMIRKMTASAEPVSRNETSEPTVGTGPRRWLRHLTACGAAW